MSQFFDSSADAVMKRWVFRQNCSLTPKQLMVWYFSLFAVSFAIAGGFWLMGLWIVIPFAGLEMLLVAIAFLYYARHATDFDKIELKPGALVIERVRAGKQERFELNPAWTRVEFEAQHKSPLILKCRSMELRLDRFIEDRLKPALVRDMKLAIARAAI